MAAAAANKAARGMGVGGEGRHHNAPAATRPRAPWGPLRHFPAMPGRGTGGARELTKIGGEVVSRGGTRDPARAPLTPKLEGTCSVWDQRRAGPAQTRASPAPRTPPSLLTGSPNPQGAGGPGSCTRRGGAGAHSVAPGSIALPLALQLSAGVRSGRDHPGTRG